jgi:hypothetical protein
MPCATTARPTQRWAMAKVILGLGLALPTAVAGQGTLGEIDGRVLDARGQPVPLARIVVPASGLAAVADSQGRFVLANVPPGPQVLRVATEGGEVRSTEVRVWAEERSIVTIRLGALPPDAVAEVESQTLPLGSRSSVTGDVLGGLPVDDVREALRAEGGVAETEAAAGPVIRGAQPGETAVFLDGVPLRVGGGRASGFGVPLAALEEATIFAGPVGAAWGDARSGVINLITRRGSGRLGGELRAATDALLGDGTSHGLNRFDASGGGALGDAFSIFVAASLLGEDALPRGAGTDDVLAFVPGGLDTTVTETDGVSTWDVAIPHFVQASGSCDPAANQGVGCRGRAFPRDWRTNLAGTVRADWRYGAGSGVALTVFGDRTQQRLWPGVLSFDAAASMGARQSALAVVGRWTQRVSGSFTTEVTVSRQTASLVSGVLDSVWGAAHRDPTMGIELGRMSFLVDFDRFSADAGPGAVARLESDADWDQLITNVITNSGTRVPLLDQNQYRLAQPHRMNPWAASSGLPTQGIEVGYPATTLATRAHWIARGFATWIPAAGNTVRFGGDWESSRLRWFNSLLLSQTDMDVFAESPRQVGAFGEYRLATRPVVLEAGLRWSRFDPNTLFAVTPGRIFTHPDFDPADPTDPADSVFAPVSAHSVLLPSLRAAWMPFRGTAVRAGVARQARHPDEGAMYGGKNRELAFAFTSSGFGGEVDWPRSWVVELGAQQALGHHLAVDVAGWISTRSRDLVWRTERFYDPVRMDSIGVAVTTNADTGSVKGLDAGLRARAGSWLEARIGYSYQDAGETFHVAGNRAHTLAGHVGLRAPDGIEGGWLSTVVRGSEVWLLFRLASGLPYTRMLNQGLGTISPDIAGQPIEPLFASTTPAIRELDLRAARRFHVAGVRWALFVDARNLLGFTNTVRVYSETGEVTNDVHRETVIQSELTRLAQEAGGPTADLRADCAAWSGGPVNCVLLRRAESRWGNGDGVYDEDEQRAAVGALYDLFFGPWTLRGTPRHVRIGLELRP